MNPIPASVSLLVRWTLEEGAPLDGVPLPELALCDAVPVAAGWLVDDADSDGARPIVATTPLLLSLALYVGLIRARR